MKKVYVRKMVVAGLVVVLAVMISCKEKTPPPGEKKKPKKAVQVKKEPIQKDTIKKTPALPPEKKEPEKKAPEIYMVEKDDWLYKIARQEFGTDKKWREIYRANQEKIDDPDLIFPGQELVLPGK
ncbi:MAG: LysM peptidoglycan-binding domain-containing protein [Bacteroidales bacterium]